eukprot:m.268195 g.268195  ORF g.268195 m.268195 type:complete len:98 (+) comp11074_c3_seq4:399-692(+)
MTKRSPPLSPVSYCRPMTKATRTDRSKGIGCFPNETLMDALARCIDPEEDGNPVNLKVIGKMYVSGDLQKPVSKFHGRRIEVHTDKDKTLHIDITEA